MSFLLPLWLKFLKVQKSHHARCHFSVKPVNISPLLIDTMLNLSVESSGKTTADITGLSPCFQGAWLSFPNKTARIQLNSQWFSASSRFKWHSSRQLSCEFQHYASRQLPSRFCWHIHEKFLCTSLQHPRKILIKIYPCPIGQFPDFQPLTVASQQTSPSETAVTIYAF